jgi:hypothetical protein
VFFLVIINIFCLYINNVASIVEIPAVCHFQRIAILSSLVRHTFASVIDCYNLFHYGVATILSHHRSILLAKKSRGVDLVDKGPENQPLVDCSEDGGWSSSYLNADHVLVLIPSITLYDMLVLITI